MTKRKPNQEPRSKGDNYHNYNFIAARLEADYTQCQLAELVGVTSPTISGYESLRIMPSPSTARIIAAGLREALDRTDSLDDYTERLFPETLEAITTEVREYRRKEKDGTEDVLDHETIPLTKKMIKQIPYSGEDHTETIQSIDLVDNLLNGLTNREREVIKLRYGLADGLSYTLKEVGNIFMVPRDRIRRIEAKAMWKLRDKLNEDKNTNHQTPPRNCA